MAHPNLPSLTHSEFPQVFSEVIDQQIKSVNRVLDARNYLCGCCYESPESSWGACDGQPCFAVATVYDTVTELELCAKHFRTVSRG